MTSQMAILGSITILSVVALSLDHNQTVPAKFMTQNFVDHTYDWSLQDTPEKCSFPILYDAIVGILSVTNFILQILSLVRGNCVDTLSLWLLPTLRHISRLNGNKLSMTPLSHTSEYITQEVPSPENKHDSESSHQSGQPKESILIWIN